MLLFGNVDCRKIFAISPQKFIRQMKVFHRQEIINYTQTI